MANPQDDSELRSDSARVDELHPPDSAIDLPEHQGHYDFSQDPSVEFHPANDSNLSGNGDEDFNFLDPDDPIMKDVREHADEYSQLFVPENDDLQEADFDMMAGPSSATHADNQDHGDVDVSEAATHASEGGDSAVLDPKEPESAPSDLATVQEDAVSEPRRPQRPEKSSHQQGHASSSATQPQSTSSAMGNNLRSFFEKHRQDAVKRRAEAAAAENEKNKLPSYGYAPNVDTDEHEDDDEDEAAASFRRMRRAFEQKKRLGTLGLKEEIQFRRMAQEEARRRANLLNAAHDDDAVDDDNMFEPANDSNTDSFMDNMLRSRQRAYADSPGRSSGKQGKGQSKHRSSSASKRSASAASSSAESAFKKPRRNKRQERAEANLFNTASLGRQRLFEDISTNHARDDQPTFSSNRKEEAFKELIASIPEEARNTAQLDKKQLEKATKKFTGRGSCQAKESEWLVKGMHSRLTHYQMLGVSVMRERETTPHNSPAGGLHADAMGLGKTVMAIANIVNDRFTLLKAAKGGQIPPTLIVAPSSIIPQWKEECEKHAEAHILGKVNIHKPSQEVGQDGYPYNFGIILTSYQQVMKSYPKQDPPVHLVTLEEKKDWWTKHYEQYKGFFHQIDWRRVVLDEATAIKNHQSQTAVACAELRGVYRWALTGTPAMNALDEFYSYFRFLKVRNVGSFHLFKKNFLSADNDDVQTGKERLIAFMRPFMIRRTHNDSLLGAKLLNLPTPSRGTYTCHFSPLHAQLYMVVQKRFIEKINIISRAGELRKQYTCILTLLLRLRQLTGHPLLIQDTMRDLLEPEDFEKIHDILRAAEESEQANSDQALIITHLRRMMMEKSQLAQLDAVNSPVAGPQGVQADSTPSGRGGRSPSAADAREQNGSAWGTRDDFGGFISDIRENSDKAKAQETPPLCVRCGEEAHTVVVTSCGHTYCRDCTFDDTRDAIAEQRKTNTCALCGAAYTTMETYEVDKVAAESAKRAEAVQSGPRSFLKPAQAPKKNEAPKVRIGEVLNTWLTADKKMLPSAKTLAVKAQLLNWFAETPNVKVIIYTQFNTMIEILAKICELEGWKALKYNGAMSAQKRAGQVKKFEEGDARILIASLRCGGLGLNLTMATRVLLVDPWWNEAVEEQAFCRTYRRGQTQETRLSRLVVHNTVDEHMIRLQDRKIGEIQSVMGEESRNKPMPLDTLLELFGHVGEDDQGRRFIYTDEVPGTRAPRRNYAPGEDEDIAMGDAL